MKHFFLAAGIQLLALSSIFAQVQGDGGLPKTKSYVNFKNVQEIKFATPDIEALRAEDVITDEAGSSPWRFGFNNLTNLSMTNSGTWSTLPNGGKVWNLLVKCKEALTINLTMSDIKLPEGNELYIYNRDKSFILGKFTSYHLYEGVLGSELIPGETAILEYYVAPQNPIELASLKLDVVTHGYRTANEFTQKAFGSSGGCNMNVNCPDGAPWVEQTRGAVMLVSGSNGFCSGSMINNTANDGKPYVLTANHCYSNPSSWIFRFNWQSATCNNPSSSPSFVSLSGATLRSRRTPTDFCLVEITGGLIGNTVPTSYNTYFSGWNNDPAPPSVTVCIHHPSGDIKKIAFDDDPAVATQAMGSSEANSSWQVSWDRNTTTEPGSSGSPLFNQNHQIIGQLWGGGASCSNLTSPDYYGRFSSSWEPAGSNSTNQLKFWLDPANSGTTGIPGFDPTGTPLVLDGSLNDAGDLSGVICGATVTPQVTIGNQGSATLTSLTITYGYDGTNNQTYNWTGSLAQFGSATVTLPTATLTGGAHTFQATLSNPNAGVDENNLNNTVSNSFSVVINGNILDLALDLDCYGSETSWNLTAEPSGQVLYTSQGYSDDVPGVLNYDFCLDYGCYKFTIEDSWGDGLTGCDLNEGGAGSFVITNSLNEILGELTEADADFGSSYSQSFCVLDYTNLAENDLSNLVQVFPNPAQDKLTVIYADIKVERIELISITGAIVQVLEKVPSGQANLNVSQLKNGLYYARIISTAGITTKRIVIK